MSGVISEYWILETIENHSNCSTRGYTELLSEEGKKLTLASIFKHNTKANAVKSTEGYKTYVTNS